MNIAKIKTLIRRQLNELSQLQIEAEAGCETVTLDQTRVGRLSRMDAMQGQAINLAAQQRRSNEIMRLQAALVKTDSADSGECETCAEPINEGRLMLDPAAKFCIDCASKHEKT